MTETTLAAANPDTSIRAIPFVIGGRRVESARDGGVVVQAPSGAHCVFPEFGEDALAQVESSDRELLVDVPLQEILSFLNRVGKNWKSDEYTRRRLYVGQLRDLLGYSEKAANAEADRIGILLSAHARMYDVVAAELGSRFVLDDWGGARGGLGACVPTRTVGTHTARKCAAFGRDLDRARLGY